MEKRSLPGRPWASDGFKDVSGEVGIRLCQNVEVDTLTINKFNR